MKLTKIFLVIVALCAISCNKEKPEEVVPPPPAAFIDNSGIVWGAEGDIVGQWSLTSYGYPVQPQIYIEFGEDGKFNLYQRYTETAWVHLKGSYTLEDNILKGKYSDGKSLSTNYAVQYGEKSGKQHISLKGLDSYMQIYVECDIPTDVKEGSESRVGEEMDLATIERFL